MNYEWTQTLEKTKHVIKFQEIINKKNIHHKKYKQEV